MTATTVLSGRDLPSVRVAPPGPASREAAARLAQVESRNVTHLGEHGPVFWTDALGSNVIDADGNVYIDLTSGFGVALLGHGSASVREALADQARLVHGMGDVHPPMRKLELLERLANASPWDDTRIVLGVSGADAVEAALKTAQLASGKPGILAFEGGYHGLTLGALATTARAHFRAPFTRRLYDGVAFAPFPGRRPEVDTGGELALQRVRGLLASGAPNGDPIGTIIVEPVQGRGGARIPPEGFMEALTEVAREHDVLVVADEVMTGIGRCGAMLASPLVGLEPDVVCVGKALGGGLPISACIAPRSVMDAWPTSDGEAIHTSTFLGHPLACAAAISVLDTLAAEDVVGTVERLGCALLEGLRARVEVLPGVSEVRGLGLLLGIELVGADGTTSAVGRGARVAESALREGLITLPAGDFGHVLELTPTVDLTSEQIEYVVEALGRAVEETP